MSHEAVRVYVASIAAGFAAGAWVLWWRLLWG